MNLTTCLIAPALLILLWAWILLGVLAGAAMGDEDKENQS